MATGMARGAWAGRRRKVAFGDGRRIRWDGNSEQIFRGNPNVARPGDERRDDLEWVEYFKGHRLYNSNDMAKSRWVWNFDFKAQAGEVYHLPSELKAGKRCGDGFVLLEPYVPAWKTVSPNKDWGVARYQQVADGLTADGHRVVQLVYPKGGAALRGVEAVTTTSFRDALAILAHAALFIGPEGGLHHGAAAMGVPGVVIFGGFIPPQVTGYDLHANLTGGAEACGSYTPCAHCRAALDNIGVDEVLAAARQTLRI